MKDLGFWLLIAGCTTVIVTLTIIIIVALVPQDTSGYYVSADSFHLPSSCGDLYNNGTDEWKDCMGVGYK